MESFNVQFMFVYDSNYDSITKTHIAIKFDKYNGIVENVLKKVEDIKTILNTGIFSVRDQILLYFLLCKTIT